MKITSDTLSVLKNFASINPSLLVRKGGTLNTVCPSSRILAEAKVSEDFPVEFAIYDMAKFLGIVSLFKAPVFEFKDTHLVIAADGEGGVRSVKYYYTNPEFIQNKGEKKIKMPETVLAFDLSEENMNSILKAASVLQAPDMCVTADDEGLLVRVCDKKNVTGNSWDLRLGDNADKNKFCFWFTVDTLKMMAGDYKVSIAARSVARFEGSNVPTNYWIAMEADSTYGKA
jgi:hypothetical protein